MEDVFLFTKNSTAYVIGSTYVYETSYVQYVSYLIVSTDDFILSIRIVCHCQCGVCASMQVPVPREISDLSEGLMNLRDVWSFVTTLESGAQSVTTFGVTTTQLSSADSLDSTQLVYTENIIMNQLHIRIIICNYAQYIVVYRKN